MLAHYHGQIWNVAELASVVDAVRCAIALQRATAERSAGDAPALRIEWRVGVNLGDVIVDGDDIHGDGVNVAARLEALAEPGTICLSAAAHDQVRDKPSLVVLPFQNMSGDPEQEYFADGMTEEITTALSPIRQFEVIAHNTALAYKSRRLDLKQGGRELGVRYLPGAGAQGGPPRADRRPVHRRPGRISGQNSSRARSRTCSNPARAPRSASVRSRVSTPDETTPPPTTRVAADWDVVLAGARLAGLPE